MGYHMNIVIFGNFHSMSFEPFAFLSKFKQYSRSCYRGQFPLSNIKYERYFIQLSFDEKIMKKSFSCQKLELFNNYSHLRIFCSFLLTLGNFWTERAFFRHQIKVYILKLLADKSCFIQARNKDLSYDQNVLSLQGNSKYPVS